MICIRHVFFLCLCITVSLAVPVWQYPARKRQSMGEYIQEAEFVLQPAVLGINMVSYLADQDLVPAFTVADTQGCHWIRYQNDRWQEYDLLPPFQAGMAMTACRFLTLPTSQRSFLWVSYFSSDSVGNNMVQIHEVIAGVIQQTLYQPAFSLSGARMITDLSVGNQDSGLYVGVLGQSTQPWYRWNPSNGTKGAFVYEQGETLSNVQDFRGSGFHNATSPAYWWLFACTGATCPVWSWDGSSFTELTAFLPGSLNSVSGCAWGAQSDQPCTWVSMVTGEARLYCLEGGSFIFRGSFSGPGTQSVQCVESDSGSVKQQRLNNKLVWQMTTGFTVQYRCNSALPLSCELSTNTLPGGVELEILSSYRIITALAATGSQQTLRVWVDRLYIPPTFGTLQLIAPAQAPTGVDSSSAAITIVGENFFYAQTLTWGSWSLNTLYAGTYTLLSQISNDIGFCTTQYLLPSGESAPNPITIDIDITTSVHVEYHCPSANDSGVKAGKTKDLSWLAWLVCILLILLFGGRYLYSNKKIIQKTRNPEWSKRLNYKQWFYAWIFNIKPDNVDYFNQGDQENNPATIILPYLCAGTKSCDGNIERCASLAQLGYLFCEMHNICQETGCKQRITIPGTVACEMHLMQKYCSSGRLAAIEVSNRGLMNVARKLVCNEVVPRSANDSKNCGELRCAKHSKILDEVGAKRIVRICQYVNSASKPCMNHVFDRDNSVCKFCKEHLGRCAKKGCKTRIPILDDRCVEHVDRCISVDCERFKQGQGEYCEICYQALQGAEEDKEKRNRPWKDRFCHHGQHTYQHTTCGSEALVPNTQYCEWHVWCQIREHTHALVQSCSGKRLPNDNPFCEAHACPYKDKDTVQCRRHKWLGKNQDPGGCKEHLNGCSYCYLHHDYCPRCSTRCVAGLVKEGMCLECKYALKRLNANPNEQNDQ